MRHHDSHKARIEPTMQAMLDFTDETTAPYEIAFESYRVQARVFARTNPSFWLVSRLSCRLGGNSARPRRSRTVWASSPKRTERLLSLPRNHPDERWPDSGALAGPTWTKPARPRRAPFTGQDIRARRRRGAQQNGSWLPGHSFSGKSTLVAALVRAGAVYYSDEFAVLDPDGFVHPYAKALSLDVARQVEELGGVAGDEPLPARLRSRHLLRARSRLGAEAHPCRGGGTCSPVAHGDRPVTPGPRDEGCVPRARRRSRA